MSNNLQNMSNNDYIYIIYNESYGGFAINRKFLIELFKKYPVHTEIGQNIFDSMKENSNYFKDENDIKNDIENDTKNNIKNDVENYLHYKITKKYIIDTINNTTYYVSKYCDQLRSNQYLIDYIFERTLNKIKKNNEISLYFYKKLLFNNKLNYNKFSTKINDDTELINYDKFYVDENDDEIYKDYKFYKNGFKILKNNEYYRFNFDIKNITKENIYDTLYNIDNNLADSIFFDDINDIHSQLSFEKVKKIYKWNITEYDGLETIHVKLPYHDIIKELLNYIWNKNISTSIVESLINKEKTIEELVSEIYKD